MPPLLEQRLSAFHILSKPESAALRNLGEPAPAASKGQQLLFAEKPSDRTLLIHSGWAIIYRDLADGRRQIMQFCLPGDLVDPCSLLIKRRDFSLAAISPLRFNYVNLNDLTGIIDRYPHLALPLLWNEARDIYLMRRHLLGIGRMTAKERLAALLLELCERLTPVGQAVGNTFALHANQQMLGDATGLSAVHVSRTLRMMESEKLLKRSGHKKITLDQAGLREVIPDLFIANSMRALSAVR